MFHAAGRGVNSNDSPAGVTGRKENIWKKQCR